MKQGITNYLRNVTIRHPQMGIRLYAMRRLIKPNFEHKQLLRNLCKLGVSPNFIIDVGANRGEWSRTTQTIFRNASFWLIEPQIEMSPYLAHFCKHSPSSRWFPIAAGEQAGELALTIFSDLGGSSFLPSQSTAFQNLPKRMVPIVTLDSLIKQHAMPCPDMLKIDVQGFELNVLKGASNCLQQTPIIILEVSFFSFLPNQPIFDQVIKYMAEHNYVVYDLFNPLRRPLDKALAQTDICFIKRDSALRSDRWG